MEDRTMRLSVTQRRAARVVFLHLNEPSGILSPNCLIKWIQQQTWSEEEAHNCLQAPHYTSLNNVHAGSTMAAEEQH